MSAQRDHPMAALFAMIGVFVGLPVIFGWLFFDGGWEVVYKTVMVVAGLSAAVGLLAGVIGGVIALHKKLSKVP